MLIHLFTAILLSLASPAPPVETQHHPPHVPAAPRNEPSLPQVIPNDNRVPAGTLEAGVLTLDLRADVGLLRPGGEPGPALRIEAFGEVSSPLSAPAPLIRVPQGTVIAARIRNDLPHPLRLHGLCERGGAACAALNVAAGETREVRFPSGTAGTYQYWATTTGMPQQFRAARDTQLSGAFIVDPPGAAPGTDRVLVITEWTSVTETQLKELLPLNDPGAGFLALRPDVMFLINGLRWPQTERLQYELGEAVRWRVLNLSTQIHPMHLHGFYFDVESVGDGVSDRAFAPAQRPRVVTQVMQPGSTLLMTWTPERAGNWLFHCHVMTHVSPSLHVDGSQKAGAGNGHEDHLAAGMTGMVLGITVTERGGAPDADWEERHAPARRLTLSMETEPNRFGDAPAYGFVLSDGERAVRRPVPVPGPTLVLNRGEPVEITLVNRLPEATSIHWHGMELESYYDGVHGWGRTGKRVTPMIEPGESFVVRFTPPRTGTFMYHTHLHDNRQLTSGLYGGMLVVEPGTPFDESTDHVLVLGRGGPQRDAPAVINNQRDPELVWKAGARHRIRVINITPDDTFTVALQSGRGPVTWRPLTKDGAPVPPERAAAGPAQQAISVGETYDFEFEAPAGRQALWLEVRSPGGKWLVQGRVIVK